MSDSSIRSVLVIKNGIANQYLILDASCLTIVDAGLPGGHRKILRAMAQHHLPDNSLKRILITHADGDHYGGANALRQATGANICASTLEAQAMRIGGSSRELKPANGFQRWLFSLTGKFFKSTPTDVNEELAAGETIPALEGLQVLETTGHTPGHLSFFLPEKKILFAGDSIWGQNGNPIPSSGANCWDEEKARQSFEKQMALQPKIICAGHFFREF